jgi:alkaline phosphatase isozyme conversion protein
MGVFMNKKSKTPEKRNIRTAVFIILLVFVLGWISGCSGSTPAPGDALAAFGSYGASFARKIALDYPLRGPFSKEEKAVAGILVTGLVNLGYTPVTDSFTFTNDKGVASTSQNVSITIPGSGFRIQDTKTGEIRTIRRQVVIGAHYDTIFSVPEVDKTTGAPVQPAAGATYEASVAAAKLGYDGINDNASGIGVLMSLANEMAGKTYGYDVVIVAFGAGNAGQAGARRFIERMTPTQVSATDAMYCVEAIFAGDKLYASAGLNSLTVDKAGISEKIYEKRRKLYEATDVAIENDLASLGADLLTNQSSLMVDLNGDKIPDVYREVTVKVSDFSPFDKAGISCVYIESFDYSFGTLAAMKDSKNPEMSAFGGQLRNSPQDSYKFIVDVIPDQGRLELRTNITAFLLLEAIKKGNWEAMP